MIWDELKCEYRRIAIDVLQCSTSKTPGRRGGSRQRAKLQSGNTTYTGHLHHIHTTCTLHAQHIHTTYTSHTHHRYPYPLETIQILSRSSRDSPQELPRCHPYPLRTFQILQFLPRSSPDPPTSAQILPQSYPDPPQILPRSSLDSSPILPRLSPEPSQELPRSPLREILEHFAAERVTFLKIKTLYIALARAQIVTPS